MPSRITIIIGPPAAGKTTYVKQHKAANDVVVDYDTLAAAFGANNTYEPPVDIRKTTLIARRAAIEHLLSRQSEAWAWIIHSAPPQDWMDRYQSAGAEIKCINPGIDTCLARAKRDNRPRWTPNAIRKWFDERNDDGTLKTPYSLTQNHQARVDDLMNRIQTTFGTTDRLAQLMSRTDAPST